MASYGNLGTGLLQGLNYADQFMSRRAAERRGEAADQRDQQLFDAKMEQNDLEKEIARREMAGQKLYALSLDQNGNQRAFTPNDNEFVNKSIVPVLNEGKLFDDLLTTNPNVSKENPIARADIIKGKDGKDRVVLGLRMNDGTVKPMTMNRSSDPNDPVFSPTVPEFMQYVQIQADPRGTAARLDAMRKRNQEKSDSRELETFKSGLSQSEHKANTKFDTNEKIRLANAYDKLGYTPGGSKKKEGGSDMLGGWKLDDAEKHIKSLVATGMGLNQNNFSSWSEDQQRKFADTVNSVFQDFRTNPDAGISGAYQTVVGTPVTKTFDKLPEEQKTALAKEYLKQQGNAPEKSGFLGFGDKSYSADQINAAKAKLSMGGASVKQEARRYSAKLPDGSATEFTEQDIKDTAKKYGITEDAVRRQLNISQ